MLQGIHVSYVHKENRSASSAVPATPQPALPRSDGRPADWRGAEPTGSRPVGGAKMGLAPRGWPALLPIRRVGQRSLYPGMKST